jgi:hypothetical protein
MCALSSRRTLVGSFLVALVFVLLGCSEGSSPEEPSLLKFVPDRWTVTMDSIHTVFMIANARPLTVDEVQDLGGTMVWSVTQILLCADPNFPPVLRGSFVKIREEGEGFLTIGDGFESNNQGGHGCDVSTPMQDAFDRFGLPEAACLWVRSSGVDSEYCAPLNVLP